MRNWWQRGSDLPINPQSLQSRDWNQLKAISSERRIFSVKVVSTVDIQIFLISFFNILCEPNHTFLQEKREREKIGWVLRVWKAVGRCLKKGRRAAQGIRAGEGLHAFTACLTHNVFQPPHMHPYGIHSYAASGKTFFILFFIRNINHRIYSNRTDLYFNNKKSNQIKSRSINMIGLILNDWSTQLNYTANFDLKFK